MKISIPLNQHTVNDRLSALDAYIKKAFGWVLKDLGKKIKKIKIENN